MLNNICNLFFNYFICYSLLGFVFYLKTFGRLDYFGLDSTILLLLIINIHIWID